MPSIVLANFDFTYLKQFCASISLSKAPIDINVSVNPIRGSPIRGVDNTSPKAPVPFAFGNTTLHLSNPVGSFT